MPPYKTQPKDRKLVEIKKPKFTTAKGINDIALGCWSMFGDHERKDVKKKIDEQPRVNPVDPKTMKSGGTLS